MLEKEIDINKFCNSQGISSAVLNAQCMRHKLVVAAGVNEQVHELLNTTAVMLARIQQQSLVNHLYMFWGV